MANVYQMVTDRIIEQLEQGTIPWRQPWCGGAQMAISYSSRKPYSMLNQFLLGKPGEWLTWKQIRELEGKVKKGAQSRFCVFYQMIQEEVENPETHEKKINEYPAIRWYRVFHIEDTEGIESKCQSVEPDETFSPVSRAEDVIDEYVKREGGLTFRNDSYSDSAYYSLSADTVVVPMLTQYEIVEEYYSTAFHELIHSTMHPSRCNRKEESDKARFADSDYSREELVAEIGSAMLCNGMGISADKAFQNSVAYINAWVQRLKEDSKVIIWASSRAEKAARYILNEQAV